MDALTKATSKELGVKGIRVNSVSPGYISTDMTSIHPAEVKETVIKLTPLGRVGTTEEVANLVAYLAGPQASWVNSQVIEATGGMA